MRTIAAIGISSALVVLGGFAPVVPAAVAAAAPGAALSDWSANGATACEKLLTPDFLNAILIHATGESQAKPDGSSCYFSADYSGGFNTITIGLSDRVTLADWNRMIEKNLFGKDVPMSGIGARAVRSEDGTALHAHTNSGRMCAVVLMPLGESPKLSSDALAKKFGTLCNQLFALP
jgi:hypothetical protein